MLPDPRLKDTGWRAQLTHWLEKFSLKVERVIETDTDVVITCTRLPAQAPATAPHPEVHERTFIFDLTDPQSRARFESARLDGLPSPGEEVRRHAD